jgi:hypothetical protein
MHRGKNKIPRAIPAGFLLSDALPGWRQVCYNRRGRAAREPVSTAGGTTPQALDQIRTDGRPLTRRI